MKQRAALIAAIILLAGLASYLVARFQPNGDVGLFIQHPAVIGWAQAVTSAAAVSAALYIADDARREKLADRRRADRDRRTAVSELVKLSLDAVAHFEDRSVKGGFNRNMIRAQVQRAESLLAAWSRIPLLALAPVEVDVTLRVVESLTLVVRRLGFIQGRLYTTGNANDPAKGRMRFDVAVRDIAEAYAKLVEADRSEKSAAA